MKLLRRGSNNVSSLSASSLWVEHLVGAALNDLVTIQNGSGDSFVGRVVEVQDNRCHVRICDGEHSLCRDSLQIWLGSNELELPAEPPLAASRMTRCSIFKTGIAPVDALFPLQHAHSIFVAGVSLYRSLGFFSALLHGALSDHQWPCLISLDTSKNEAQKIRRIWEHYGLEDEGLFVSDSRDQLYQSMTPLRLGWEAAIGRANEGRDVFLMVLDLESWARFYQEDMALRGYYRSRAGALNGFKNALSTQMQLLYGHKGRITVAMLLSERKVAGLPSELLTLRDLFDSVLILRGDGALSLNSYTPQLPQGMDRSVEYARLLRCQCKELRSELKRRRMDEYPLSKEERAFDCALHEFLSDLESRANASPQRIWQILALMPERRISRVPLSLLREYSRNDGSDSSR